MSTPSRGKALREFAQGALIYTVGIALVLLGGIVTMPSGAPTPTHDCIMEADQ